MAISPVISGLVSKREDLGRLLAQCQDEARRLCADIESIDSAIKLIDPDYDLTTIKRKAQYTINPWFEHGEAGRMVLDTLRTSVEPLSTRQIGEVIASAKGLHLDGNKEWEWMLKIVLGAARRLENKGIIKAVGRVQTTGNPPILWQLV
jgi:hypothetical protein